MSYDRIIRYIDMYDNEERVQNAGFVRLERRDNQMSIHIQVAGLKRTDTCLCPVIFVGTDEELELGSISIEQGNGSYVNKELSPEGREGGMTYDTLVEIKILLPKRAVLRCIINNVRAEEECVEEAVPDFKSEAELLREAFEAERKELEKDVDILTLTEEKTEIQKKENLTTYEDMENIHRVPAEDKWQQLWEIYPHIRPFEDSREYLLVKPEDFVILQDKYFCLSSNSFLLHGYYNYNHLIMGKSGKKNHRKFYIGVPGNFYDKEKQVAVLFGFESFEGRNEPVSTGEFGYYMVDVEI